MRLTHALASPPFALLAGLLQAAAQGDPVTHSAHGWLQGLSLAFLFWQLVHRADRQTSWSSSTWVQPVSGKPWRRAFVLGWTFGLGWLAGTWWWLFISMHTYGGLAVPLAAVAVLALAGALAIYYALAAALFQVLFADRADTQPGRVALGFAALWTLAELLRGSLFTGFPWGAGGYAHVDGWLAAYARWVGVYGMGALAAWLAARLVLLPRVPLRRSAPALVVAALLLGWGALWPSVRGDAPQAGLRLPVALLQGNIPQDEKFIPGTGVVDSLRWYGEQLQAARAPLVVAPETALPLLPAQLPPGYWEALVARYRQGGAASSGQAALLGVPLGDLEAGYTNSVIGIAPGHAAVYRYDKHHLVPFGEFIPTGFRWFVHMMAIPLGDFARGGLDQASFAWRGQRLAPNVCYEDLFGEELGARFADPARAPTAFVNVSNIAWFGNTVAIDQHLAISRLRALEFERPMLRATNTGATAVIDHYGRVTHSLARHTRGVLQATFEGRTHLTPFARWVALAGLWPLWGLCLGVVLLGLLPRRPAA